MTKENATTWAPPPEETGELFSWFRQMREAGPVLQEDPTGIWHIFGYPEVAAVLSDHQHFSNDFSGLAPAPEELAFFVQGNFAAMDPPQHRKIRGLVTQVFTPKFSAKMEARIRTITRELMDGMKASSSVDVHNQLSFPMPVMTIAEVIGVPGTDVPLFKQWTDVLLSIGGEGDIGQPSDEAVQAITPTMRELNEYLRAHVRRKRDVASDDLISLLTNVEVDGSRLSDEEIVGFVALLLITGQGTTLTIGNALLCLDQDPQAKAALRADYSSIPGAVEEVIRYRSQAARTGRLCVEDATIGGATIPRNGIVTVWLAAANRDPRQFADPDTFDFRRSPNQHLALGHGIHFCLGASLARTQARVVLEELFERTTSFQIDKERTSWLDPRSVIGPKEMSLFVEWR
ncbi:cytochrome P450 [Pseudosporangium ferrugineum]|uniref:Cytochrome P450 n=1 Tax=Pseudosporangium ferrugineum TaxID=439699 RepID=A0A2T0R915_9ACTN|nr:cytochrome P450 [Pseudosporangium ferrugineum]PRY17648.1 cytochrome P450 [Pseudosporangium ferrugineum]